MSEMEEGDVMSRMCVCVCVCVPTVFFNCEYIGLSLSASVDLIT